MAVAALVLIGSLASCGSDADQASPSTVGDAATTTGSSMVDTDAPATTESATTESASTEPAATEPAATGRVVVSFAEAGSIDGWSNVDDTVMGGVSASTTSWAAGRLVFAGELSLENDGGFTSVRGPEDATLGARIAGATALAIDAVGDGRTYVLQLRTADGSLHVARFTSVDGVEQAYELPLASFEPVTRFLEPSPGSPPLDPSAIVQLAIYLLDGQEGPFRLEIEAIRAR